jgi:hypothetical protein
MWLQWQVMVMVVVGEPAVLKGGWVSLSKQEAFRRKRVSSGSASKDIAGGSSLQFSPSAGLESNTTNYSACTETLPSRIRRFKWVMHVTSSRHLNPLNTRSAALFKHFDDQKISLNDSDKSRILSFSITEQQ